MVWAVSSETFLCWVTERPQEHLFLFLAVGQRPQLIGKPPSRDHIAGYLGGSLNVVLGTCGDALFPEYQLLGDTAAEQARNLTLNRSLLRLYLSSSGRNMVTPRARPRGMILTL